jgi:transcriptional regulator with XRE-family HTH domain
MSEAEIDVILGSNVKKFRKQKHLTQEALASALEVSTNYVSDVERGKTWVSATTFAHLADIFEIEPMRLLDTGAFYEVQPIPEAVQKYAREMAVIIARELHP